MSSIADSYSTLSSRADAVNAKLRPSETIDRTRLARAIHEYNANNGIDCMHENDEPWSWDCVNEAEDKADIYERFTAAGLVERRAGAAGASALKSVGHARP